MDDDAPSTGDYVGYAYDYWNRLITEERHISTNTHTVSCEYDAASRLTRLTYSDNMQALYSYDDLNRTTEIKRYVGGVTDEILLDNIQCNTESLLTQFDYVKREKATYYRFIWLIPPLTPLLTSSLIFKFMLEQCYLLIQCRYLLVQFLVQCVHSEENHIQEEYSQSKDSIGPGFNI